MSSDSESKVVVAGSSAEDIVQGKKMKRGALFGDIFKKKMIQKRNAYIVTMSLKGCKYYWFITPFEAYASKRKYMY